MKNQAFSIKLQLSRPLEEEVNLETCWFKICFKYIGLNFNT